MKFSILTIGKIKERWMKEGIQEYVTRLSPFVKVDCLEQSEEKMPEKPSTATISQVLEREGEKLLRFAKPDSAMILLDTKGRELSSIDLAEWIQKQTVQGVSSFQFYIGGPYGNGENLRAKADLRFSMGPLTMTHQMVRLLLMEQLYRSMKIIRREPYHL